MPRDERIFPKVGTLASEKRFQLGLRVLFWQALILRWMRGSEIPSGASRVRGAREHNLKDVSFDLPRNALVVFTGRQVQANPPCRSGRYMPKRNGDIWNLPYAGRLFHQMAVPEVDEIEGLPPAVALQQQRGSPTTRSSVGSVTTLSNLLRMMYSRAGDYPPRQPLL